MVKVVRVDQCNEIDLKKFMKSKWRLKVHRDGFKHATSLERRSAIASVR
jgi:hypothetical protein